MNLLPNVDLGLDILTICVSGFVDSETERWEKGLPGGSSIRNKLFPWEELPRGIL